LEKRKGKRKERKERKERKGETIMTTMPDVPTTPISPRADAARQMGAQVRTIVESLDGFLTMSSSERLRVNPSANVPDRFLEAVAVALEASETLASSTRLTPR
jgi:hypothetical protein